MGRCPVKFLRLKNCEIQRGGRAFSPFRWRRTTGTVSGTLPLCPYWCPLPSLLGAGTFPPAALSVAAFALILRFAGRRLSRAPVFRMRRFLEPVRGFGSMLVSGRRSAGASSSSAFGFNSASVRVLALRSDGTDVGSQSGIAPPSGPKSRCMQ